jgi:hypothetical protein
MKDSRRSAERPTLPSARSTPAGRRRGLAVGHRRQSCLARIARYPVTEIKLDRFPHRRRPRTWRPSPARPRSHRHGHRLVLTLTAEGVETTNHLARVPRHGCPRRKDFFSANLDPPPGSRQPSALSRTHRTRNRRCTSPPTPRPHRHLGQPQQSRWPGTAAGREFGRLLVGAVTNANVRCWDAMSDRWRHTAGSGAASKTQLPECSAASRQTRPFLRSTVPHRPLFAESSSTLALWTSRRGSFFGRLAGRGSGMVVRLTVQRRCGSERRLDVGKLLDAIVPHRRGRRVSVGRGTTCFQPQLPKGPRHAMP